MCAVFSRYGYSPADDSPFANRIFDPAAVDDFFDAPPETSSAMLLDYHGNTNYSVVDVDLIDELYRRVYQEKVLGEQRLRLLNVSRARSAAEEPRDRVAGDGRVAASPASGRALDADVRGLRHRLPPGRPVRAARRGRRPTAGATSDGRSAVERDYRLAHRPASCGCGIYLQGGTEHTHGITSSLLSNTAVRSGEILRSIVTARATHRPLSGARV